MYKLTRDISIDQLLKSDDRKNWEKEHVICYGIIDNMGMDSFSCVEEITHKTISVISSDITKLNLRCRYNLSRKPFVFLYWITRIDYEKLLILFETDKYKKCSKHLMEKGHKCQ